MNPEKNVADDLKKTTPRNAIKEERAKSVRGRSLEPSKSPSKKVSIPPLPVHMIRRDNS